MILVDPLKGSRELLPMIQRAGYPAMLASPPLAYADFCFEGNGPKGPITVGIERKSLHDMLHCIDDARYAGYQRGGMKLMYNLSFLSMEGLFKPHDPEGWMMEGWKGGASWGPCKYRQRTPPYAKLFNYLTSVALSGVIITFSRDLWGTAYNVCMLYDYFQKRWEDHTSLQEAQVFPLQEIGGRPTLVRKMAAQIDGIGVKLSAEADMMFESAWDLGTSDERDWVKIPGVSAQTALRIAGDLRRKRGSTK